ncbi:NAD(P)H-binding protein [Orbus sturtevantii]|uniref:NAD(P)H-binding protein n=1 Tax=Orbus sturtevantii TaxID=3074109 RepID=UPI00370DDE3F
MRTLLIFGASRGTGWEVAKQALARGDKCIAVVRTQDNSDKLNTLGIKTLIGDANDAILVEQACVIAGKDATIISTLGGVGANYQAQINIINQAEKVGINRLILVTSLGCGDSWLTLSERAKKAFGFAVREKTLAEVWLKTSSMQYIILRPGGLVDSESTHNAKFYQKQEVHGYVARSDLAKIIIEFSNQTELTCDEYSIIDPDLVVERSSKQG